MILQVVQYTYIAGDSIRMESSTIKPGSTLRKYRRCKSFTSFRFCYAWVKLFRIPLLQKPFSSGPFSTSWVASQRFSWVCTSPLVHHFPHDHNILWVNMAAQLFQGNILEDRKKWMISLQIQWLDPQKSGHDADACQVQIPASPAIGGANWTTYQNAIWGGLPPYSFGSANRFSYSHEQVCKKNNMLPKNSTLLQILPSFLCRDVADQLPATWLTLLPVSTWRISPGI